MKFLQYHSDHTESHTILIKRKICNYAHGIVTWQRPRAECNMVTVIDKLDIDMFSIPGVIGGAHYRQTGGGSNLLCMVRDPEYHSNPPPRAGVQTNRAYIYGAEYEYEFGDPFYQSLDNRFPPCAVCLAEQKSVALTVPGKRSCPNQQDWTLEYSGFIMAEMYSAKHPSEFICVDMEPEVLNAGFHGGPGPGARLFMTEGRCTTTGNGGLPCGPDAYRNGFEIACAVCTK